MTESLELLLGSSGAPKKRSLWSNFTTLPLHKKKKEIIMLYLDTVLYTFQSMLITFTGCPKYTQEDYKPAFTYVAGTRRCCFKAAVVSAF